MNDAAKHAALSLTQVQEQMTTALTTITRNWDHMLPSPASSSVSRFGAHGARTSSGRGKDNSDDNDDVASLDVLLSARGEITAQIAAWCHLVLEEYDVTTQHVNGLDVHEMVAFLKRWVQQLSGNAGAEAAVEELQTCAKAVMRYAQPTRKDWIGIGLCPLRNDETRAICSGNVRSWPDPDAGESWATCQTCGTKAVVSWWEREMFGGEGSTLITSDEVRTFVHLEFGKLVSDATIRQWKKRRIIEPSGEDSAGRTLYDKGAIAYALQRRQAV